MKKWLSKKVLRRFLLTVSSILIVAIGGLLMASGFFTEPQYLEPWKKTYSDQFQDKRIQLAAHGILAPNGHNMQPWKIKLDANVHTFYLYSDSERLVKEVDPYARQTMITQGTFLAYLKVAGEKMGYNIDITLFPNGLYDEQNLEASMKEKPVASVVMTPSEAKPNDLYDYMFLPDTNRAAYKQTPLTKEQLNQLQAVNTDSGMTLNLFQDEANVKKLGAFAIEGASIESVIPRINAETALIFRANEYQKNKHRYGFSVEGQGTTGIMKHIVQGLLTVYPAMNDEKSSADRFVASTQTAVDNTPAYAMIITKDNSRIAQVKSGMLYGRLVLNAHHLGLVMQPPSQVLEEYAEMRVPYAKIHETYAANGGTIQMFFRIGQPTKAFPNSMRRDVMDFIIQ